METCIFGVKINFELSETNFELSEINFELREINFELREICQELREMNFGLREIKLSLTLRAIVIFTNLSQILYLLMKMMLLLDENDAT